MLDNTEILLGEHESGNVASTVSLTRSSFHGLAMKKFTRQKRKKKRKRNAQKARKEAQFLLEIKNLIRKRREFSIQKKSDGFYTHL